MATQVQFRRGTTAETASFTGASGEITVDLTKHVCVVHDAIQVGGYPLMLESGVNSALSLGTLSNCSLKFLNDPNTGFFSPGPDQLTLVTGGVSRITIDSAGAVSIPGNFNINGDFVTGNLTIADKIIHAGDTDTAIRFPAADTVTVETGGAERTRITSAGLVGIGTSSPGTLLDVVNGIGRIRTGSKTGSNTYLKLESTDASNSMELQFSNSTNANWQIQSTENGVSFQPLILNPSGGNVGIGTTSPGAALHISNGNDSASGEFIGLILGGTNSANARTASLIKDTTTFDLIYQNNNFSSVSGSHVFRNGNSEHARIDSSGILRMGGITPATSINHSICTPGRLQSEASYTLTTASSANVFISTEGLFSRATSSLKYKTDVEDADIDYSEALVYGSRPVWYRSLSESDPSDYSYWGFIAEEVAEIDPRMVHWGDDGPEGVQYDRYVVHLVGVIQKQQQRLDALEARIAALES